MNCLNYEKKLLEYKLNSMDETYSISQIAEASKNILNKDKKNSKIKYSSNEKNNEDKKIYLKNELNKNVEIKKNHEVQNQKQKETLDKIYYIFNKKIKRNTLKIIFEQGEEIHTLKQENKNLSENRAFLETSNKNLLHNLIKINLNNKNLSQENETKEKFLSDINNNLKSKENKIKELINLNNNKLKEKEEEIKDLKNLNLNISEKISQLEESNKKFIVKDNKFDELKNKLKFYQEENLRLSNELFNSNKKNDVAKKYSHELEMQKNQIQNQIQELNKLVRKSNLVTPSFSDDLTLELNNVEKDKETVIKKDEKKGDLDNMIKKIFGKK
mgnify:FL=1